MTSQTVGIATRRDPILSKVHSYLLKGWPEVIPPELRQYYSRMAELSVEGKWVLWGKSCDNSKDITEQITSRPA